MSRGTINCPTCGCVYHVALYDYHYIHCNIGKSNEGKVCGTYFDKITGKILDEI